MQQQLQKGQLDRQHQAEATSATSDSLQKEKEDLPSSSSSGLPQSGNSTSTSPLLSTSTSTMTRAMARGGAWRKFEFGFTARASTKADCSCGVTSRADCAGDCRKGDGHGGYNANNLNGAQGGLGEDVGGHCGKCGGGLALVVKRVDLKQKLRSRSRMENSSTTTTTATVATSTSPRPPVCLTSAATTTTSTLTAPTLLLGPLSLMPVDAVGEMFRADTVSLLRQLRPSILRWPGGNFASGYCC